MTDFTIRIACIRHNEDGSEQVEEYRDYDYWSLERWQCAECRQLNYGVPDQDDPDYDYRRCEHCGHFEEQPDVEWWIVCGICQTPLPADSFGQHVIRYHAHLPEPTDQINNQYV